MTTPKLDSVLLSESLNYAVSASLTLSTDLERDWLSSSALQTALKCFDDRPAANPSSYLRYGTVSPAFYGWKLHLALSSDNHSTIEGTFRLHASLNRQGSGKPPFPFSSDAEEFPFLVTINLEATRSSSTTFRRVKTVSVNSLGQDVCLPDLCYWKELQSPSSGFQCTITIRASSGTQGPVASSLAPSTASALESNLGRMLNGEDVLDTKFVLFSKRRTRPGTTAGQTSVVGAMEPRALYASAAVLSSASDYFQNLLMGTFSESAPRDLNGPLNAEEEMVNEYDYASDSDLDPEEEEEESLPTIAPSGPAGPSTAVSGTLTGPVTRPARNGHVVIVKDAAYKTWKGLIIYLYTSKVKFAPLTSTVSASLPRAQHCGVSAKSMYRLADKLNLTGLATLSLEHIRTQLNVTNVLEELFSAFTSQYPAVLQLEKEYALENWEKLDKEVFKSKTKQVVAGELPHAEDAMQSLLSSLRPK